MEEQIVEALKEHKRRIGTRCMSASRDIVKHVSRWKSKHGGMKVPKTRRLKRLEGENAQWKRRLADAGLIKAFLNGALSKPWSARRSAVS